MLNEKMKAVIDEVCSNLAEREELVHTIALALLTRKNLFVLGKPGQAKSQAIDLFRSHINGAKQFEILMSKGIDQEQLFGHLDLASIIPGHISHSRLKNNPEYSKMRRQLDDLIVNAKTVEDYKALDDLQLKMQHYKSLLALQNDGTPEMLTENKIPESYICFLDEIFKSNDGVLNSLLKALNERVYTNEGVTVDIPVISFFSASNEIPNFNNPEEQSLRALYDRFDFKVNTRYVENKSNRMRILRMKQRNADASIKSVISLDELYEMQKEVKSVKIPEGINELADNILCELRRKEISVTDRIYFNFSAIVQAEAWLNGRNEVIPSDMEALVNYLWDKLEQTEIIREVIKRLTENPLGKEIETLLAKAYQFETEFESAADKSKSLINLRSSLLSVYEESIKLKSGLSENDAANSSVDGLLSKLEEISSRAHAKTSFTYVTLEELKLYKSMES